MKCPSCGYDAPTPYAVCPNCGYAAAPPFQPVESFGKRHPAQLIAITLALFIAVVAAGVGVYWATRIAPLRSPVTRLPVEHGERVRPDQLTGHGKLYFVPVGRQAISAQELADYYAGKFRIDVTVLPALETHASDCVPTRRQCIAEELESEMTTAYAEIARNPESVMIALTDEDIFPRDAGWDFTYSWHSTRIGIVSTHRMNPAFWGHATDPARTLAATRQMLTKYVAMEYFHLPESLDPTSVMFTPLTPNGKPDDIYESDLHPEASANGRRGKPYACLYFTYSYETHAIAADNPMLSDCYYGNPVFSVSQETFQINLGVGVLTERAMDFRLDSNPALVYRRGYNSYFSPPVRLGLGWNTGHSFNAYLGSDGVASQKYIQVFHEGGSSEYFARTDNRRGFDPNYAFKSTDDPTYGARLTWDSGHYKLQYRDGAVATFLPCDDPSRLCYWNSYRDAQGKSLRFDRSANGELSSVTSESGESVNFRYDNQHQILEAQAGSGEHVTYEYDSDGNLAAVHRADGAVSLYGYDAKHHMTSFSVLAPNAATPEKVLTVEYDDRGRVVKQTLAGAGSYSIAYLSERNGYASTLRITGPAGQVFEISSGQNEYIVRTTPIRFPVAGRR